MGLFERKNEKAQKRQRSKKEIIMCAKLWKMVLYKERDRHREKAKANQGPFGRVKSVLLAGKRFGKARIESKSDGEERKMNLTTRISFFSFFLFFFGANLRQGI